MCQIGDLNGDGVIDPGEARELLSVSGFKLAPEVVDEMVAAAVLLAIMVAVSVVAVVVAVEATVVAVATVGLVVVNLLAAGALATVMEVVALVSVVDLRESLLLQLDLMRRRGRYEPLPGSFLHDLM